MNGGFLDNSSDSAISTSTYNPRQDWASDWTFIGSKGANSDLNMGAGPVTIGGNRAVTVSNALTTLTVGGAIAGTGEGLRRGDEICST